MAVWRLQVNTGGANVADYCLQNHVAALWADKVLAMERFFPYLVEIDVLKLYNTFKIYLPRGIFIWTNLLSYLTQPMN